SPGMPRGQGQVAHASPLQETGRDARRRGAGGQPDHDRNRDRADVVPPPSTWAEIFAPEINASGITLCADNFGSNAQFQNLQLWRCHGYASNATPQRWEFEFANLVLARPVYRIANVGSGLCIGLDPNRVNAGTIAGSNLVQESCINSPTLWELIPATDSPDPNNQFILRSAFGGLSSGPTYAMEANTFLDQNGN